MRTIITLVLVTMAFCNSISHEDSTVEKSDTTIIEVSGLLREVSPYYLSLAVSSQIVRDGLIGELASSKRFITLSRGLAPAILRVGGSAANFLTYDPSLPGTRQSSSSSSSSRRNPGTWKSEVGDYDAEFEEDNFENFTMTGEDFENLKSFAKEADLTILFDLNQFYRTPEDTWDPTNSLRVIQDSDESFLWQLGNEPNSYYFNYKYNFTGTMDAADFLLLTEELKAYYENAFIVGPDVTSPHFPLMESEGDGEKIDVSLHMKFLDEFLAHLEVPLSVITWHQYYLPGTGVSVENYTSVETLDKLGWQIPQVLQLRDKYCPGTPIWITETSSSTGGGAKDLSNTYVAGFLWLDKLGLAAVMGMDLLARQTLYQKRYALISTDYIPYPDYWLSLLFKQLVGEKVLHLDIHTSSTMTRLYGHCQKKDSASYEPGNIVIYGVNLDYSNSVTVKLFGMPSEHAIDEYLLQPPGADLQSKEVMLNGELLQMTSDEELPDLPPLRLSVQEFEIPPVSFGFWVIRRATVLDCM